jgi:hypothetical protein
MAQALALLSGEDSNKINEIEFRGRPYEGNSMQSFEQSGAIPVHSFQSEVYSSIPVAISCFRRFAAVCQSE